MNNSQQNIVIDQIISALTTKLPGEKGQLDMSPKYRTPPLWTESNSAARQSAVLILLYPIKGKLNLVLIRRTADNSPHSGQISLPGGKFEPNDHTFERTALRETEEELGITTGNLKILGCLSTLYVPVSNFMIHPYVAYSPVSPVFKPSMAEVAYCIETSIEDLFDPKNLSEIELIRSGISITAPCFMVGNNQVWGATAMILSELKIIFEHNNISRSSLINQEFQM